MNPTSVIPIASSPSRAGGPRRKEGRLGRPMPEGRGLNAERRMGRTRPAARVTNVLGGMGALWNCVTPRLVEWPGISETEYARAEEALRVGFEASQGSRRQEAILDALRPSAQAAPLAGRRDRWTGPAEILGEGIELLSQHAVRKLRHQGGRVTEAEIVALASGEAVTVTADP